MALRPLNSVAGISVGSDPQTVVILANGDITTTNITVSGVSDLGPIGNVKITGGSSGQVITTDGTGNLTFSDTASGNSAAPMPYIIPVGESYSVPENFQGLFTVPIEIDGTLEVNGILAEVGTAINSESGQIIFDDNGELTGNAGFSFDQSSGNLSVPGSGIFTGNLLPTANITYDLGSPTQRWKDLYLSNNTIYLGTSTISGATGNIELTNAGGGTFTVAGNATVSTLENGNSSVSINANANITVSVTGTSNVAVFSSNAFNVSGNVIATGVKTNNYYYANGNPLDVGGNPGGSNTQIQFNTGNEFDASANLTFNSTTNLLTVSGNVSITKNLQLTSNSAISINNSVGNAGQVLTSDGTKTFWATNFYYGDTPPDFATLNYGDIFFFIDTPNNTQRLYMWVTDGSSSYFYDFLPPSF
jgi:hypothetical protein